MAREVASRSITVNAVAPGYIETAMTAALDDKQREAMLAYIPLGRPGATLDVAHAVSFLASEEAAYITGHVLDVNGGAFHELKILRVVPARSRGICGSPTPF